jgi:hypothetical protein
MTVSLPAETLINGSGLHLLYIICIYAFVLVVTAHGMRRSLLVVRSNGMGLSRRVEETVTSLNPPLDPVLAVPRKTENPRGFPKA